MTFIVFLKMVPDVVEELEIAADGRSLNEEWLRTILSEWCDHALEEALLLKERHGGSVIAVALDAPEVDDVLFAALARGADRAVKLTGTGAATSGRAMAEVFHAWLTGPDSPLGNDTLLLTGSQAIDDLEGEAGVFLADRLGLPYAGVITGVTLDTGGRRATIRKEFAGGLRGEFEAPIPVVLGIQAAEKPPRYVPVAKVRAAMKDGRIEEVEIAPPAPAVALEVEALAKPEPTGRAEMIEGSPEDMAARLVEILAENGVLQ